MLGGCGGETSGFEKLILREVLLFFRDVVSRRSRLIKVVVVGIGEVLVRVETEILVVGVFADSGKHRGTHGARFHGEGGVG